MKLLLLLLLATPVLASDYYEPIGTCTVNEGIYPEYKVVRFYIKQDAEEYQHVVNGMLINEDNVWYIIHADGLEVPDKQMTCSHLE